jgi:peptidase E
MPARQIVAIGGGVLLPEDPELPLERYLLRLTGRANPSICLLPTATGDAERVVARFYDTCARLRCRPSHVPLFARTPDLPAALLKQDVIFVGGGNTKSMLAVWRDWDLPAILRRAWRSGVVLAGVSAGAICWFDTGVTDSWADQLRLLPCLGWLPGTCCPHYDSEPERRPTVHRVVERGEVARVLALDDGVGAHFVGRRLARVVSGKPGAGAYRVHRKDGRVVESPLTVTEV